MNNNRPSKPNLPSVPKPSKLLAPMRLCRTYFFSSFLDSAVPNSPFTEIDMVRKGFSNKPLKDLTMERKRIEEFEESLNEDWDESILFFFKVSLSKFSLEALFRG